MPNGTDVVMRSIHKYVRNPFGFFFLQLISATFALLCTCSRNMYICFHRKTFSLHKHVDSTESFDVDFSKSSMLYIFVGEKSN